MAHQPPDGEEFAPLAKTLRGARQEIVDTWMRRTRQEVGAARKLEALALQNSLPHLLDALDHVLESARPSTQEHEAHLEDARIARFHGEERHAQLVYDLVQVVHEYRLLRVVIFDLLFRDHGPLSHRAVSALNQFFDIAISQAADAFAEMRLETHTAQLAEERDAAAQNAHSMAAENAAVRENQRETVSALRQTQASLNQLGETLEAKEQFVSFLSHDLRSPLTAIILTTQILARRLEQTPHETLIQRIGRAAVKADTMLRDFLDTRRVGADQHLLMHFADCDFSLILQRLHQDMTQRYGPRFALHCPATLCGHWDGVALERALENLCSNSVKYGDATAPIRLELSQRDDASVAVSVTNLGNPISTSDQRRLFRPFYRAQGAKEGTQEGWGLGLAYVMQVAQLHGGKAHVFSSAQAGTTVSLSLPRDAREAFDTAPRRSVR